MLFVPEYPRVLLHPDVSAFILSRLYPERREKRSPVELGVCDWNRERMTNEAGVEARWLPDRWGWGCHADWLSSALYQTPLPTIPVFPRRRASNRLCIVAVFGPKSRTFHSGINSIRHLLFKRLSRDSDHLNLGAIVHNKPCLLVLVIHTHFPLISSVRN